MLYLSKINTVQQRKGGGGDAYAVLVDENQYFISRLYVLIFLFPV